jgi:hypothetical protein
MGYAARLGAQLAWVRSSLVKYVIQPMSCPCPANVTRCWNPRSFVCRHSLHASQPSDHGQTNPAPVILPPSFITQMISLDMYYRDSKGCSFRDRNAKLSFPFPPSASYCQNAQNYAISVSVHSSAGNIRPDTGPCPICYLYSEQSWVRLRSHF